MAVTEEVDGRCWGEGTYLLRRCVSGRLSWG